METKKRQEEKLKHDENNENRLIEAYNKAKDQLNKITKIKWKEGQANKQRRSQLMGKTQTLDYINTFEYFYAKITNLFLFRNN